MNKIHQSIAAVILVLVGLMGCGFEPRAVSGNNARDVTRFWIKSDVEFPGFRQRHAADAARHEQDGVCPIRFGGAQRETRLLERFLDLPGVIAVELHPAPQHGMHSHPKLLRHRAALCSFSLRVQVYFKQV